MQYTNLAVLRTQHWVGVEGETVRKSEIDFNELHFFQAERHLKTKPTASPVKRKYIFKNYFHLKNLGWCSKPRKGNVFTLIIFV